MGAPRQPERGNRDQYQARYRVNVGPCIGVDKSGDTSTLPDTALAEGINCTIRDGIIFERGGQEKVHADAMSGCVYGMIEIDGSGGGGGLMVPNFFLTIRQNSGDITLGSLDAWLSAAPVATGYRRLTEDALSADEVGYGELGTFGPPATAVDDPAVARFCFTTWNGNRVMVGKLVTGVGGEGYAIFKLLESTSVSTPLGIKTEEIIRLPASIVPASLVTIPKPVTADAPEGGEYLFIGTLGGGVVVTDGNMMQTALAEATLDDRVIVSRYHDTVYACATQEIRRLTPGTLSTWTVLTMPAAAFPAGVVTFYPTCWAEWRNKLYVGGWDDNEVYGGCILSVTEATNGTITVAVAHTPTHTVGGSPRVADYIYDICGSGANVDFGSWLLYGYQVDEAGLGGEPKAWLGTNSGSAFTDEVMPISSIEGEPGAIGRMYRLGDAVFISALSDVGGVNPPLVYPGMLRWTAGGVDRILTTTDAIPAENAAAVDMIPF